jgi:hypothetical protein
MQTAIITVAASTFAFVALSRTGLSRQVWPPHPFLTAIAIGVSFGVMFDLLLAELTWIPEALID